jgi:hypothetical protein
MRTGISAIWLSVFIVLLLINVAVVVVSSIPTSRDDEALAGDTSLLAASDEVQLDWWAQNVTPGEGPPPLKPLQVNFKPTAAVVQLDDGNGEIKDYQKLMAGYIKNLKQYLNEYFHITAYRIEEPEE